MKPVIIQTLFKKMKARIKLPDPPSSESIEHKHRDRTTQMLLWVVIISFIIVLFV